MTSVASIFGELGLDIDKTSFDRADKFLQEVRHQAEATTRAVGEALSKRLPKTSGPVIHGDVDPEVSWEGWNKDTKAKRKSILAGIEWQKGLKTLAATLAVGGYIAQNAAEKVFTLGDSYNSAASRVRQLTNDTAKQTKINNLLFDSAQETATEYDAVTGLYQQVGKAAVDSGRSLEQAVGIVDTINKAIKAGGTSAEGSAAALTQLAQGLGSGTLRGEEFNSVIEQAPILIDILAKDLKKTRGEMRALANAGGLTSKVVLKALERQKGAIDEAFGKRIPLVSDAFVRMKNTASKAFGELLQRKDVAETLSAALKTVGETVMAAIKAFGEMVVFFAHHGKLLRLILTSIIVVLAALAAQAALTWLALTGPIMIVALAVAALIVYFDDLVDAIVAAAQAIGRMFVWIGVKLMALMRLIRRGISSAGDLAKAIGTALRSAFAAVVDWISDKVNWVIDRINWVIRQANRLPGINIGQIGSLGKIGAGAEAAAAVVPTRAAPAAGGGVQIGDVAINVNSPNADPKAVAVETRKAFQDMWSQQMRNAGANIG